MSHDQSGAPGAQAWLPGDLPAPLAEPAPEPQPAFQPQPAFPPPSGFGGPRTYPGAPAYPNAPAYPGAAGPAPYGRPTYYGPPVAPRQTPTLAILALVLAFLAPLIGLVLSIVAVVRSKADGNGRGLPIAALVVNIVLTPILAAIAIPVFMHQRELAQEAEVEQAFTDVSQALALGDCAAYLSGTTPMFQEQLGATTCAEFAAVVDRAAAAGVPLGNVQITDVEVWDDTAFLTTVERVVWDDQTSSVQSFTYWLVREDGVWLMNTVSMVG